MLFFLQIKMSPDFRQFQQMMEIEFGIRFNKLFRGPGWSGGDQADFNYPLKVIFPEISLLWDDSLKYSCSPCVFNRILCMRSVVHASVMCTFCIVHLLFYVHASCMLSPSLKLCAIANNRLFHLMHRTGHRFLPTSRAELFSVFSLCSTLIL